MNDPFGLNEGFAELPTRTPMHSHDRTMLANLGFADPDKKNPEHDRICRYLVQPETIFKIGQWLNRFTICESRGDESIHNGVLDVVSEVFYPSGSGKTEFHLTKGSGQYRTTVGFIDVVLDFSKSAVFTSVLKKIPSETRIYQPQYAEGLATDNELDEDFECLIARKLKPSATPKFRLGWDDEQVPYYEYSDYEPTEREVRRKFLEDNPPREDEDENENLFIKTWRGVERGEYKIEPYWIPIEAVHRKSVRCYWNVLVEVKVTKQSVHDILRQLNLYSTYFTHVQNGVSGEMPRSIVAAPWAMTPTEIAELKKNGYAFLQIGKEYKEWCKSEDGAIGAPDFSL